MKRLLRKDGAAGQGSEVNRCRCGCGARLRLGRRYVRGHNKRKVDRYTITDTGYKTPCWIWKLAKNNCGYGMERRGLGNMKLAHRVSWEDRHEAVPAGKTLDHLCRVRACVNPDHLEPVTHAENCRRGRNAKLTPELAGQIRSATGTQRVIARQYGISQGQVSRIRRGLSWRGVDGGNARERR